MTNGSGKPGRDRESLGRYGSSLYKYWAETYSYKYIDRWLKKHKYDIDSCETDEFIYYMIDCFFNWVNKED